MTLVLTPRPELFPGFIDQNAYQWAPWGGEPQPLTGESDLVKGANALQAVYAKRVANLRRAERAPDESREAVLALHASYLDAIEVAAHNGEESPIAADLKARRDACEAEGRSADFEALIAAANAAVESAREAYLTYLDTHWAALLGEKRAAAIEVTRDYQRVSAEAEAKLAVLRGRWGALYEHARAVVGNLDGRFTSLDLPDLNDYSRPPIVSAEAAERNGGIATPARLPA